MPADKVLRLGIAGAGTVACGLLELLQTQSTLLTARTGARIVATVIAVRDAKKPRPIDLSPYQIVSDPLALVSHPDVDVVVELMGGAGDPALSLVRTALQHKKPVITANKAMLATHGTGLSTLAHAQQTPLLFEGSVGGGVPFIKLLREGLAGNRMVQLAGILNGTCNYILTNMEHTGREFAAVLADAQAKGYAEADPTLDVDGGDTAHKLAILQSLATNTPPHLAGISVTGIRTITADLIGRAAARGFRIKLLGVLDSAGARVAPHLVAHTHPLAGIEDAFNALAYVGDPVGPGMLYGRGAGAHPTASAALSDLMDLATGRAANTFGLWPFAGNGAMLTPLAATPPLPDPDLGLPVWG